MQILQITLLIADYMNMIGKTAPGTLSTTATPLTTPKNRGNTACSRSSSRARGQLLTAPNTPRPDHKELTPRLSGVMSSNDGGRRKWSHLDWQKWWFFEFVQVSCLLSGKNWPKKAVRSRAVIVESTTFEPVTNKMGLSYNKWIIASWCWRKQLA